MDGYGCGELHRITGRHVAVSYVSLLQDVLMPSLEAMRPGGAPYVFQQDNTPQHTAKVMKNWIVSHAVSVCAVLAWQESRPEPD